MRAGGRPIRGKQPTGKSLGKIRLEFFGAGVKLGVARGVSTVGDVVKVGPETFRDMGAAVGGVVVIDGDRAMRLLPSNKVKKNEISVPVNFFEVRQPPATVTVTHYPPSPDLTAATSITAAPLDENQPVPDGVHQVLRQKLLGKIFSKPFQVQITLLGETYTFNVDETRGNTTTTTTTGRSYIKRDTPIVFRAAYSSEDRGKNQNNENTKPNVTERPSQFSRKEWDGVEKSKRIVIYGEIGVGKTYCAKMAAEKIGGELILVTDSNFMDEKVRGVVGSGLQQHQQCCLVADDLQDEEAVRYVEGVAAECENSQNMTFIITCLPDAEPALPPGVVVTLEPPSNPDERLQLLTQIISKTSHNPHTGDTIKKTSISTHGYTAADLTALIHHCELAAVTTPSHILSDSVRFVRPSSLKSLEISVPNVRWTDIGGQEVTKKLLKESVEWPLRHKELFMKMGVKPPSGVLLYGPPGCSKTMLAKALATECEYNFIAVKGPELFDKYVGESEKAVRRVFRKARGAAPAVIFFDEIDGMCGKRGGGGVSDRVISQFLTEMDGLPSQNGKNHVIVLAATNRPDHLDPALLRPGRIDRKILITLPSPPAITSIITLALSSVPLADNVSIQNLTPLLEGRTGAEIVASVKEGILTCLARDAEAERVDQRDLIRGLNKVLPRTTRKDLDFYDNWGN